VFILNKNSDEPTKQRKKSQKSTKKEPSLEGGSFEITKQVVFKVLKKLGKYYLHY
jgi:hypothetical protein